MTDLAWIKNNFSSIILAGGKANRMGGIDKLRLEIKGTSLIDNVIKIVSPIFCETIIAEGQSGRYDGIKNVVAVSDHKSGYGPLAGILAGLKKCKTPWAFVVAADMPNLDRQFILHIARTALEQSQADKYSANNLEVVIPKHGKFIEPLHAAYNKSIICAVQKMMTKGQLKLRGLFNADNTYWLNVDKSLIKCFANINTSEDLNNMTHD